MDKQVRLNSEKKIQNDSFSVNIGTTNKLNPLAIYVNGRTFIQPNFEKEEYDGDITDIRHNMKNTISRNLRGNSLFEQQFILNFDIASSRMLKGKKSFLSFQVVFKQKSKNVLKLKDLKTASEPFVNNIVFSLTNDIISHDFTIHKSKK